MAVDIQVGVWTALTSLPQERQRSASYTTRTIRRVPYRATLTPDPAFKRASVKKPRHWLRRGGRQLKPWQKHCYDAVLSDIDGLITGLGQVLSLSMAKAFSASSPPRSRTRRKLHPPWPPAGAHVCFRPASDQVAAEQDFVALCHERTKCTAANSMVIPPRHRHGRGASLVRQG